MVKLLMICIERTRRQTELFREVKNRGIRFGQFEAKWMWLLPGHTGLPDP
jgi:hypothetical protein